MTVRKQLGEASAAINGWRTTAERDTAELNRQKQQLEEAEERYRRLEGWSSLEIQSLKQRYNSMNCSGVRL